MIPTIVVAMAENHVIGKDGGDAWTRNALDRERFHWTLGNNPIIVGLKTFLTLPGWLWRNRHTIVLSTRGQEATELQKPEYWGKVFVAPSLQEAIQLCNSFTPQLDPMIIGGEHVYHAALSDEMSGRIHLTIMEGQPEGDAFFPKDFLYSGEKVWKVVKETPFENGMRYVCLESTAFILRPEGRDPTSREMAMGFGEPENEDASKIKIGDDVEKPTQTDGLAELRESGDNPSDNDVDDKDDDDKTGEIKPS